MSKYYTPTEDDGNFAPFIKSVELVDHDNVAITNITCRAIGAGEKQWVFIIRTPDGSEYTYTQARTPKRDELYPKWMAVLEEGEAERVEIGPMRLVKITPKQGNPFFRWVTSKVANGDDGDSNGTEAPAPPTPSPNGTSSFMGLPTANDAEDTAFVEAAHKAPPAPAHKAPPAPAPKSSKPVNPRKQASK